MTMSSQPDNLVEKRQVIYASLMRYAPEATSLRERLLDRLVLAALIGSSQHHPFRIGDIRANILFAPSVSRIRTEVIQESLQRLLKAGMVQPTELKSRHAYYLTGAAATEIEQLVSSGEDLFAPVLSRMLENTAYLFPYEVGSSVCRAFLCECFARFGADIARTVTGELAAAELIQLADVEMAFEAATSAKDLSKDAADSLRSRCHQFLDSHHAEDVRLRFHLTQGFYFAQLLGLPGSTFNPLGEQAFAGSVLYLDTNVLIVGLLAAEAGDELFREMVAISKKIGATLRVTRATINETRRVAADRHHILCQLLEKLPVEVIQRTGDQFVTAFLEARELEPELTPEAFLEPFDHLSDTLSAIWGIEIDERVEDEMLGNKDLSRVGTALQHASLRFRKFEKSEAILRHDVSHYALVISERAANPKTWFLTRDRSVAHAALDLREGDQQPFSFSLLGFLQAISPFVHSDGPERRFADLFSGLMQDAHLPTETLFSPRELLVLLEMHNDVLSTPQTSLVEALDYVKTVVLRGEPYKGENCNKVALGLRTFLASSGDDRRRELERQRSAAEREAALAKSAAEATQERVKALEDQLDSKEATIIDLQDEKANMATQIKKNNARESRFRLALAIAGLISATIWWAATQLLSEKLGHLFLPLANRAWVRGAVASVGMVLFLVPSLYFLNKSKWNDKVKYGIAAALILIALASSRLIDSGTWHSSWAGIIEALSIFLSWLVTPRPVGRAEAEASDLSPQ